MRRLVLIALLGVGTLLLTPAAQAQSRLFLATPIGMKFSGDISGSAESVSGYALGYGFSFHLGLGVDRLRARANDQTNGLRTELTYKFTDVFAFWRGYGLDWQVGYGKGHVEVAPFTDPSSNSITVDRADASQKFITVGYPLGQSFTVHLGYHLISADSPNINVNGTSAGPFNLDAKAYTLGAQLAF